MTGKANIEVEPVLFGQGVLRLAREALFSELGELPDDVAEVLRAAHAALEAAEVGDDDEPDLAAVQGEVYADAIIDSVIDSYAPS